MASKIDSLKMIALCSHDRSSNLLQTLIYLQNNIKTSKERNPPSFERRTSYGLFYPILEAKMRELFRELEKDQAANANIFQVQFTVFIEIQLIYD